MEEVRVVSLSGRYYCAICQGVKSQDEIAFNIGREGVSYIVNFISSLLAAATASSVTIVVEHRKHRNGFR